MGGWRRAAAGEQDAEYQAYMREFVKAHQLGDKEAIHAKLARLSTLEGVLELAMGFERTRSYSFPS